nr:MAG: hypothetical protein [Mononegavirales sp.]
MDGENLNIGLLDRDVVKEISLSAKAYNKGQERDRGLFSQEGECEKPKLDIFPRKLPSKEAYAGLVRKFAPIGAREIQEDNKSEEIDPFDTSLDSSLNGNKAPVVEWVGKCDPDNLKETLQHLLDNISEKFCLPEFHLNTEKKIVTVSVEHGETMSRAGDSVAPNRGEDDFPMREEPCLPYRKESHKLTGCPDFEERVLDVFKSLKKGEWRVESFRARRPVVLTITLSRPPASSDFKNTDISDDDIARRILEMDVGYNKYASRCDLSTLRRE